MNNAIELRLHSPPGPLGASRKSPRRTAFRAWPTFLAMGLVVGLLAGPAAAWSRSPAPTGIPPLGPGTVFASVEEAAFDALRFASLEKDLRSRGRIRAGTIFRLGEGFSYEAPAYSRGTIWTTATPVVRFEFTERDVASFVVHPRSGRASLDRMNEGLRAAVQRRVERSEASTRPLFLLTPKRRVIRYAPGEEAAYLSGFETRTVAATLP